MVPDTLYEASYKKTIIFLSVVCSVFALLATIVGYIALPFASAFYASLLVYEKKERRIASFLIPIIFIVVNFAMNGLYSLEGIAFVIIGFLLFCFYNHGATKAKTAFYITFVIFAMMVISLLFFTFDILKATDLAASTQLIRDFLSEQKSVFSETLLSIVESTNAGEYYRFSVVEIDELFNYSILMTFPIGVLISFLITGISFKIFSLNLKRFSKDTTKIDAWIFTVGNFVTYLYIVVTLLDLLTSKDSNLISTAIAFFSFVLSFVYAYLGFKFLYHLISRKINPFLTILIFIGACVTIPVLTSLSITFVIQLVSYVGVFFSITFNKLTQ